MPLARRRARADRAGWPRPASSRPSGSRSSPSRASPRGGGARTRPRGRCGSAWASWRSPAWPSGWPPPWSCRALGVDASAGSARLPARRRCLQRRLSLRCRAPSRGCRRRSSSLGLVCWSPSAPGWRSGSSRRARPLRVGDTWGCGRIGQTPRMEYTATAFAEPLRRVFAELYRPTEDLSIDFHPESQVLRAVHRVPQRDRAVVRALPLRAVHRADPTAWAARVRALQSGSVHAYLAYLVVALLGAPAAACVVTGP